MNGLEVVDDIIITGYLNQHLGSEIIRSFFLEIEVYDLFSVFYDIPANKRVKTYKQGQNCIDTFAISFNLITFFDHARIIDFDEAIKTDHRGIVCEFRADKYLEIGYKLFPKPTSLLLDPDRDSHKAKFVENSETLLSIFEIKQILERQQAHFNPEINFHIDETLTYILNDARRHAEGPLRHIPFSPPKIEVLAKYSYWHKIVKKLGGSFVDDSALQSDRIKGKIELLTPLRNKEDRM